MDPRMTVRQLIEEVDLIPETVLAVRDGQLLSDDAVLEAGDEVKLIAVISGG
jgi:sulfur carrier protein ThiS